MQKSEKLISELLMLRQFAAENYQLFVQSKCIIFKFFLDIRNSYVVRAEVITGSFSLLTEKQLLSWGPYRDQFSLQSNQQLWKFLFTSTHWIRLAGFNMCCAHMLNAFRIWPKLTYISIISSHLHNSRFNVKAFFMHFVLYHWNHLTLNRK